MPTGPRSRPALALLLLLSSLLAAAAGSAGAAPLQSWVATARIRSGNTTLTSAPSPPSPSAPTDSTGFLEAKGSDIALMPPVDAGAIAEYDLPDGILAVSAGFDATANFPGDLRVFEPFGGASAIYIDDLTVSSSTLAAGTPVTVRFVFVLGFTTGVGSTQSLATARADVASTAAGVQGLESGSNRFFEDLETGTVLQNGLFLPPHADEYTVETTVGSTFSFSLSLDGDAFGTVFVTGSPGNETNGESNGWMSAAVAFGGEVVGADAQLTSALLAGPFPPPAVATSPAAEAAIPDNPFAVPEPGAGSASAAALACLAAIHRARRRSAGDPPVA